MSDRPPIKLPTPIHDALVADLAADRLARDTDWDAELAALLEREGEQ